MKYIKNFNDHSNYINVIDNNYKYLNKHVVSYCKSEDHIHIDNDPYNGHDYIEIGGLKWATMNVGANSITDTGLYFQWGDTQGYTAAQVGSSEGQKYFGWTDYKYTNDGGSTMTKYNSTDNKTVLEASDDAVAANWGDSWRMPTTSEYYKLFNAVNTAWTADYQSSGVSGLVCTDKTDSSKVLFFPAAGQCGYGKAEYVGRSVCYWSSSLNSYAHNEYANLLYVTNNFLDCETNFERLTGFPVRGVAN